MVRSVCVGENIRVNLLHKYSSIKKIYYVLSVAGLWCHIRRRRGAGAGVSWIDGPSGQLPARRACALQVAEPVGKGAHLDEAAGAQLWRGRVAGDPDHFRGSPAQAQAHDGLGTLGVGLLHSNLAVASSGSPAPR